jgi:hypothetical protein
LHPKETRYYKKVKNKAQELYLLDKSKWNSWSQFSAIWLPPGIGGCGKASKKRGYSDVVKPPPTPTQTPTSHAYPYPYALPHPPEPEQNQTQRDGGLSITHPSQTTQIPQPYP